MDNFFLNDIVAEMAPVLIGRQVSRIGGTGAAIRIDFGAGAGSLIISLDQANSGLYLASASVPHGVQSDRGSKRAETPFTLLLKSRLTGSRLLELTKRPDDRIVNLALEILGPDGQRQRYSLVLAFTGRSTNAFLVRNGDQEGAFRENTLTLTDDQKEASLGAARNPRESFVSKSIDEISDLNVPDDEIIRRYFSRTSPLGPVLRKEFEYRAREQRPANALMSILVDLAEKPHSPLIYSTLPFDQYGDQPANPSKDIILSCTTLTWTREMICEEFGSFSEAAGYYYRAIARISAFNSRYLETTRIVAAALKKETDLLRSLQRDISRFEDPDRFKRYGDLLLASQATAERTKQGALVTNLYDPSQLQIEIPMEEGESFKDAAARYYTFYQKARRALQALRPRAADAIKRVTELTAIRQSLESTPDSASLLRAEKALGAVSAGAGSRRSDRASKKEKTRPAVVGRRFKSSEGYEIVVGRSDKENDAITFRVAGSLDIWLHAADYPGSHVVVLNPRRQPIPYTTIVEAASVAAFYSQAKKEKKAAVHYTQKKFVTKPPKSKPGLVRLSSFKTVMVEPGIKVKKVEDRA